MKILGFSMGWLLALAVGLICDTLMPTVSIWLKCLLGLALGLSLPFCGYAVGIIIRGEEVDFDLN